MTHTQGEWYAKKGENQMVSDDTTVASLRNGWFVFSAGASHGNCEQDAKLMAAAPDLLWWLGNTKCGICGLRTYEPMEASGCDECDDRREVYQRVTKESL